MSFCQGLSVYDLIGEKKEDVEEIFADLYLRKWISNCENEDTDVIIARLLDCIAHYSSTDSFSTIIHKTMPKNMKKSIVSKLYQLATANDNLVQKSLQLLSILDDSGQSVVQLLPSCINLSDFKSIGFVCQLLSQST